MTSYLATTALLFGLLAAVHVWRVIAEWPNVTSDPGAMAEALIGAVALGLCLWAISLLRRPQPRISS
jgi:hypothetical protein